MTPFSTEGTNDAVHVLADEGVGELDAGVARFGFDAHPDFGELAGAAGLFLVAVFRVALGLDGFAVADARLDQLDVDVVAPAEAVGDDFEVQLALGGDDGLAQLGIHHVKEGRVFVVQGRQAGGDFVFLALDAALERGVDVGLGIFDFGQRDGLLGAAERVAGVGVLELDHRADVAGAERRARWCGFCR